MRLVRGRKKWENNNFYLKVCLGNEAKIRLEESGSEKVFAECLVEAYPGVAVQPVTDSSRLENQEYYFHPLSRYFVMKVKEGGKTVHLGLGFAERADSSDLNTSLHQHFGGILVSSENGCFSLVGLK